MDLIDRTKLPLEIGDKVTYAGDNKIHTIIGYFFSRGFNNYCCSHGYVIDNNITRGYELPDFCYDEIGRPLNLNNATNHYVLPSTLTLINEENMKEFTKKDLKTGMIIELNNGDRYLLANDTLIGKDGQRMLSEYKNDLTFSIDKYIINKVYLQKDYKWVMGFNKTLESLYGIVLLWERPNKVIEMSIEEIANKLNIPVNQFRIKK